MNEELQNTYSQARQDVQAFHIRFDTRFDQLYVALDRAEVKLPEPSRAVDNYVAHSVELVDAGRIIRHLPRALRSARLPNQSVLWMPCPASETGYWYTSAASYLSIVSAAIGKLPGSGFATNSYWARHVGDTKQLTSDQRKALVDYTAGKTLVEDLRKDNYLETLIADVHVAHINHAASRSGAIERIQKRRMERMTDALLSAG